jgi:hypothetical protein
MVRKVGIVKGTAESLTLYLQEIRRSIEITRCAKSSTLQIRETPSQNFFIRQEPESLVLLESCFQLRIWFFHHRLIVSVSNYVKT